MVRVKFTVLVIISHKNYRLTQIAKIQPSQIYRTDQTPYECHALKATNPSQNPTKRILLQSIA